MFSLGTKQETDSKHITTTCHTPFMITEDGHHPPVVHLPPDQDWHSSQPASSNRCLKRLICLLPSILLPLLFPPGHLSTRWRRHVA